MSQTQPSDALYPNTNTNTNPLTNQPVTSSSSSSSSHSHGSFAPVFAVLAVIVVLSAMACVFGRFFNRKKSKGDHHHHSSKGHKQQSHNHQHHQQQQHGLGPKEWESKQKPSYNMGEFGDIEYGFGKPKFPAPQKGGGDHKHGGGGGGGGYMGHRNGGDGHGHVQGYKQQHQQVRYDDDFSGM